MLYQQLQGAPILIFVDIQAVGQCHTHNLRRSVLIRDIEGNGIDAALRARQP